jgi:hypothetical protein
MSWNGTVRCGNCYDKGHNRNGCPKLKEEMQKRLEADPDDWRATNYFEGKKRTSKRTCGYCQQEGHNRKTCSNAKEDRNQYIQQNQTAREKALDWLKKSGVGVGTLVKFENYWSPEALALVESVNWTVINAQRVLVDEEGVGIPDVSCLMVAKVDGSTERSNVNPRNVEILGTIPTRLVTAQTPYGWLDSRDEATLSEIDAELKSNNMGYIRRHILKTEPSPY